MPSMVECDGEVGNSYVDVMSPTFLWPRTPPSLPRSLPRINTSEALARSEVEESEALELRCSFALSHVMVSSGGVEQKGDAERKNMKIDFYHILAAKRAAALNRVSAFTSSVLCSPPATSVSRFTKHWKKMLARTKVNGVEPSLLDERSRFTVRGVFEARV